MLSTCLINSYNYRPYVGEAVESALGQLHPFDQILVIDDGSTDGSRDLLERQFGREPRVQIVGKKNGGQLSCFNHAVPLIAGDLVFFLDADDRYRPSYLATALACYERTKADFLIAGMTNFGADLRHETSIFCERDWGFSVLATLLAGTWVGCPTSCLSMKSSLAKRILPCPFEPEWRISADNVLVYGTSLWGAHKYQLGESLIERRVHGANRYYGRRVDQATMMRFALAKNRLIAWYAAQAGYNIPDLLRLLPREFRTLERPTIKEYRRYLRLSFHSSLPMATRAKQFLSLSAHMVRSRRKQATISHANLTASQSIRRAA